MERQLLASVNTGVILGWHQILRKHQKLLRRSTIALLACCISVGVNLLTISAIAQLSPDWINRSNALAKQLSIASQAKDCRPKTLDNEALQSIDPTFAICRQTKIRQVVQILEQDLATEKNPEMRLDLEILRTAGRNYIRSSELKQKYKLPYIDLSEAILETLKSILDESIGSPKQAVLSQLKKYAGMDSETAIVKVVEMRIREKLQNPELELPTQESLDKDLQQSAVQIDQIQSFLAQQNIPDYQPAYAQLKDQLFGYEMFIRRELLPKVEQNFRLPAELYAFKLQERGIDVEIKTLAQQAHLEFAKVQRQMDAIAPPIVRSKGLKASGYREVIRALQAEQLSAQDSLRLYQKRGQEIAAIIEREDLVTLASRSLKIRLSTDKEDLEFPVPLYDGVSFVLPVLKNPEDAKRYNDFTNPAMAWTLTAHEGIPGHHLQFATLRDHHLSNARRYFAENTANVEGWGTYAESILQPYMPIEGRFMSLQFQLLRSARAFLEPELQSGQITKTEALRVLTEDAGFSSFFAQQEVRRYTMRMPSQAPAYFYGFQQFLSLRSDLEKSLGQKFKPQAFHDLILAQGPLPPSLLRRVIQSKMQPN